MIYLQYKIEELEGLCNQLMAVFRTIGEALFYINTEKTVYFILNDFQTRTSVNFDTHPFFKNVSADSFIDINKLTTDLKHKNINVISSSKLLPLDIQNKIIHCRRFPIRQMTLEENKELGLFIAKSFPFSKKIVEIADLIINLLSVYSQWMSIHLRIEKDLIYRPDIQDEGINTFISVQFEKIIEIVTNTENLSAIYIASGIHQDEYNAFVNKLKQHNSKLIILNKKEIFKNNLNIQNKINELTLEEQALIDWLVCIKAPLFSGPHSSSFSYLAGYVRHYQGINNNLTNLFPNYEFYWDKWFPRV